MFVKELAKLWQKLMERTDYEKCQRPRAARFSLEPATKLLHRLQITPPKRGVVHIAGSKGKGSTAHFLERGARAGGVRTGLFTSPHLSDWNERIQIDGVPASDELLVLSLKTILDVSDGNETFFDLLTATAVYAFIHSNCELWILETGLGGRYDSTNAVASNLAIVTSIELEHTDVLGDTLEKIAGEKAGIFKAGTVPWTCINPQHEAFAVLKNAAQDIGQELRVLSPDKSIPDWFPYAQEHMCINFQMAMAALEELDITLTEFAQQKSSYWQLPGRFELRTNSQGASVLFDVAHSEDSIRSVLAHFRRLFPGLEVAVLFALRDDKDASVLAKALAREPIPKNEKWYCLSAGDHPRSAAPDKLAESFVDFSATSWPKISFPPNHQVYLVTGSTYLVGALRPQTTSTA